jgi:hypothetical protein
MKEFIDAAVKFSDKVMSFNKSSPFFLSFAMFAFLCFSGPPGVKRHPETGDDTKNTEESA